METIPLPGTDLRVSRLCLGLGEFGTRVQGAEAERLLAAFLEASGNFVDTAHCYAFWAPGGLGASERELGRCLRALGARVVVGTKGGHPDGGPDYPRPDAYLAPEVIARDLSESLERIGVPSVDLYYLHRDDPRVPFAEILDALNREVAAGRIRWPAASNWSLARIVEANAEAARRGWRGFAASQAQWSLATPTWSSGPDPTMRAITEADAEGYARLGLPVVAYSATANGWFSDSPRNAALFDTPANRARRDRARALAERIGRTPTQVALAYLLHQPALCVPAFSTTRVERVQEAVGACHVPLTAEDLRWLRDGAVEAPP